MDYLNIYNYFYNKTIYNTKYFILNYYKISKNKNRPVSIINNNILQKLHEYRTEKYSKKLLQDFSSPYNEFVNRHKHYEGDDQDRIKWVLEDEVLKAFGDGNASTYFSFIGDLAVEQSLVEIIRQFKNYYSYYELVYELERYEYFYLKDFEGGSFESSEEYNEMMDIKYPERIEERKKRKGAKVLDYDSLESNMHYKAKRSIDEVNTLELINNFNDDERFLIINVFHKLVTDEIRDEELTSSKITIVDVMKVMKIAGSFNDVSIFFQKSTSNTSYSKVNKGSEYYSGKSKLKIIESTINKLTGFDLEIFVAEIQRMKTKYLESRRRK